MDKDRNTEKLVRFIQKTVINSSYLTGLHIKNRISLPSLLPMK